MNSQQLNKTLVQFLSNSGQSGAHNFTEREHYNKGFLEGTCLTLSVSHRPGNWYGVP